MMMLNWYRSLTLWRKLPRAYEHVSTSKHPINILNIHICVKMITVFLFLCLNDQEGKSSRLRYGGQVEIKWSSFLVAEDIL